MLRHQLDIPGIVEEFVETGACAAELFYFLRDNFDRDQKNAENIVRGSCSLT